MIWLLVILLPLLAGIAGAFISDGKKGTGYLYLIATLPALWLGLVETSGVSAQWFLLEAHFALDTPRQILLLLAGGWWTLSPILLPIELMDHITGEKSLGILYFGVATNLVAAFPIFLGGLIIALTAKFPSLNYWPTKRPLIPAGDFLVVILWLGAIGSKLLNRLLAKLEGWTKSVRSPEQILYQIIDDKRTVGITAATENLLRRWDVVGLSFLAMFLMLFLFLR